VRGTSVRSHVQLCAPISTDNVSTVVTATTTEPFRGPVSNTCQDKPLASKVLMSSSAGIGGVIVSTVTPRFSRPGISQRACATTKTGSVGWARGSARASEGTSNVNGPNGVGVGDPAATLPVLENVAVGGLEANVVYVEVVVVVVCAAPDAAP
jgi:hypothetical protein